MKRECSLHAFTEAYLSYCKGLTGSGPLLFDDSACKDLNPLLAFLYNLYEYLHGIAYLELGNIFFQVLVFIVFYYLVFVHLGHVDHLLFVFLLRDRLRTS